MKTEPIVIGKWIKEKRISKRLTQFQLAEKCDISPSYLSYIESGTKSSGLEVLIKIANVLDISLDSLLLGNQIKDSCSYEKELNEIMKDCTPFEKQFIVEVIGFMKKSLRENKARYL